VSAPLGVTGSTDRLGGRIARLAAARGADQRLLARTPSNVPPLPGTTVAEAAYADPDAVRRACAGLDVVLMVPAAESEHRLDEHRTFVDAAVGAGVRHLVYVSFFNAGREATFLLVRDHHVTEAHIERSGLAWTFLRDNLYADFFPSMAGDDGVIRGPAGEGRVSAVAQDDIAAAATEVLLAPATHAGRTYDLTGPEAMTMAEVAATMTRALGRSFSFHDETLEEAYAWRAGYGAPAWQVDAWVSTDTAIASGELSGVSGDVQRLTGRAPRSPADLLAG
jgi:NAD(P)H dehydrogenase (quinone)